MKSRYPYLIMVILFVAGNRLVNRQQQYIRSVQASQGAPTAFTSASATTESSITPLEQGKPKQVQLPTAGGSWETNPQPPKNYTTNEKPSVFGVNIPVSH